MVKNINKKGFTLVELLVTIILLGIIGAIVIYNMTGVTSNSKEKEYERFVAAVKSSASVYADLNPEAFDDLYVNKSYVYITAEELIKNGLIDEEITNPYTGKIIGYDEEIKANLDNNTGSIVFEYPIENKATETFLVTISDYVVWGEPYDCMQGAGSYELALSEENGDLIMLDSEETIEKYHFECSMPSGFNDYYDSDGNYIGKSIDKSGNYEVTYSWITSSGTRKTATRTLKVLPKVRPTFKTNFDYDFEDAEDKEIEWFTPTYNETTKEWTYLTYTPFIEGADPDSTIFRISKQSNDPNGDLVWVEPEYTNEYTTRPVDDGDKTYTIETRVFGHHYKDYYYEATGSAHMKSKLIIPSALIAGASTKWATDREFKIYDTWSPVGVEKYEFYLATEGEKVENDLTFNNLNSFAKNVEVNYTDKYLNIIDTSCVKKEIKYPYVYFRAINKDGYVGDWSPFINAYLTNNIVLLVGANSCSSGSNCCVGNSKNCTYNSKVKYLKYDNKKFVIFRKQQTTNKNGKVTDILWTAYTGVSKNRVTPTTLQYGSYTVKTCDGTFSKNYSYSSPLLQRIIDEGNNFFNSLPKGDNGAKQYVHLSSWPAGYNSYVGNVDLRMYNDYSFALYDSNPYWTTTTYSEGFEVHVDTPYAHGNHTTAYNTYFYAIDKGSRSTSYAGKSAFIKPILKFKPVYTCGGNGTNSSPYIVATQAEVTK